MIVIPDLDTPREPDNEFGGVGLRHAKKVCESITPFAEEVKLVEFHYHDFDLQTTMSVSYFLDEHPVSDLLVRIRCGIHVPTA